MEPVHVADYFTPVSGTRKSITSISSPVTPRTSEVRTHSETVPYQYLRHERTKHITEQEGKLQFLNHVFQKNDVSVKWNLDLSDLRYNPEEPRKAEAALTERLNKQIHPSSKNIFYHWGPSHNLPHPDIVTVRRDFHSTSVNAVFPDVSDIQSCIEHTVISGANGREHNQQHAYAKINELLKCPVNLSIIVLGVHASSMTLWYADRSGIIEVDLGKDQSLCQQAVLGLSNFSTLHDPCVAVHRLNPHRILKFTLCNNFYYGIYGVGGESLYIADGIACRGTLVFLGLCATAFLDDDDAGFFNASDSEKVVVKVSHPSEPWAAARDWRYEWQILQLLNKHGVRNVPQLVDHVEDPFSFSTKVIREAVGLQDEHYRTRTILVTQPLAKLTLHKAIALGIELPVLVQVMKDVVDAHEDAWRNSKIAHCDVSPANIQIHHGQGILADWEFGMYVSQLSSDRAVNTGTLDTMPPRLAYHRLKLLYPSPSPSSKLTRTIWDEICSIYLCFVYALTREYTIHAHKTADLGFILLDRMDMLSTGSTTILSSQYQSNLTVVAAFKSAASKVFQGQQWRCQPDDASSELWWDRLRGILDSFVSS